MSSKRLAEERIDRSCSSGHGGQTQDVNGDEEYVELQCGQVASGFKSNRAELYIILTSRRDGFDEVIYPLDHKVSGHIVDDEL